MRQRRVALVSPYAFSVYGGVQEQVLAMSRVLSARGHEVLVVAPDEADHHDYDTPAMVRRFGRRVSVPANGSRAPLTLSLAASRRARDVLIRFSPDVVHYHEPFAPVLAWSSLVRHAFPSIATFHRSGGGPALALTGPLLRYLARGLDRSVAVSDAAATTAERAYGVDVDVLYNGFETERFVDQPRTHEDETLVLYLGRLEQRKGVSYLIRAVREHNARDEDPWTLVVAGEGPERARLEALAAHDERVRFVGAVSDADKRAWLRRSDVLVAPSVRGESFGLTLLEGMASETRVVASDIEGYREAAGGHATLAKPADSADLARAISRALSVADPAATTAARQYAEEWSMRSLVERYEEIYERAHEHFFAKD